MNNIVTYAIIIYLVFTLFGIIMPKDDTLQKGDFMPYS